MHVRKGDGKKRSSLSMRALIKHPRLARFSIINDIRWLQHCRPRKLVRQRLPKSGLSLSRLGPRGNPVSQTQLNQPARAHKGALFAALRVRVVVRRTGAQLGSAAHVCVFRQSSLISDWWYRWTVVGWFIGGDNQFNRGRPERWQRRRGLQDWSRVQGLEV